MAVDFSSIKGGIVDSHAHLTWESFAEDQEEVIKRAFDQNISQIMQAGVDIKTIPETIKLAERYDNIFVGVGLHPHDAKLWNEEARAILSQSAQHKKVLAIGECGLDYYYNHSDRQEQIAAFAAQIKLARELMKPLIIHTRDAWSETFELLHKYGEGQIKGVFHCFTGGPEVIPQIKELDFYVSFSGILTFNKATNIQEAAALVEDERLMVETDCPYLTPQPFRGKRNEPAYVWYTAEKLAKLRQTTLSHIAVQTSTNARRLFAMPDLN